MTPEERALVDELFDRLAALESASRDREAERVIEEGLRRAPHAVYALVQTVLVQDEALKAAHARLQELEGSASRPEEERSFLEAMRDNLFGREERRGSVPSVRPRGGAMGVPPGFGRPGDASAGPAMQTEDGRGGSFLGTAAAAAAGVVGGALLLNTIRSAMAGQSQQGPFAGVFDQLTGRGGGGETSPWGGGAGGDLARQAGIEDIGGGRSAAFGGDELQRSTSVLGEEEAPPEEFDAANSFDDEEMLADEVDDFGDDFGGDDLSEA